MFLGYTLIVYKEVLWWINLSFLVYQNKTISDITNVLEQSKDFSSELPDIEMDIHDTCALFYSSGTTGFPKAVEITHDNFVSQCMMLDDPACFNFTPETVNVSCLAGCCWFARYMMGGQTLYNE